VEHLAARHQLFLKISIDDFAESSPLADASFVNGRTSVIRMLPVLLWQKKLPLLTRRRRQFPNHFRKIFLSEFVAKSGGNNGDCCLVGFNKWNIHP
jgi:hypothetical protein